MKNIDYYLVDINNAYGYLRDIVDVTDIQYGDNYFDIIICVHVLEHIRNDKLALEELFRVLKPGRKAFLITLYDSSLKEILEREE